MGPVRAGADDENSFAGARQDGKDTVFVFQKDDGFSGCFEEQHLVLRRIERACGPQSFRDGGFTVFITVKGDLSEPEHQLQDMGDLQVHRAFGNLPGFYRSL